MFGFGFCWYGPYQYYWYNLLDYFMPAKNTANFLSKARLFTCCSSFSDLFSDAARTGVLLTGIHGRASSSMCCWQSLYWLLFGALVPRMGQLITD